MKFNDQELNNLSNSLRIFSADMVEKAQSGHPGMPLGMADILTILIKYFLNFNSQDPKWPNRDRLIFSNGHGSALLYSIMYFLGYADCTLEQLKNFRQLNSKTAGHPEFGELSGIEATTGPLGQGLSNAVGMAIAQKKINSQFSSIDHKIFVIVGDGCLMEGISHESLSLAGHLQLNNLIVMFDCNYISIDGPTDLSVSDNHKMRLESYGFEVLEADGHNLHDIYQNFEQALNNQQKPVFIIFNTKIGKYSGDKENSEKSHGAPLGSSHIQQLRENLNWHYEPFECPQVILDNWKKISDEKIIKYEAWQQKNQDNLEFKNFINKDLITQKLSKTLTNLKRQIAQDAEWQKNQSTRQSFGAIMSNIVDEHIIGGSSDLSGSNCTINKKMHPINRNDFSGNYLYFGVREQAMAGIMNGISLYGGFLPYGGTFLIFSDYCRAGIRLSALMKQQVLYVMTHDSIGLGEDGPTHQPIEHLASLRAMPNLLVLRPADLIETVECMEIFLNNHTRPTVLALSRQNLPQLSSRSNDDNLCNYGAYMAKNSSINTNDIKVQLFASGSELSIAYEVQKVLENEHKISVQIISVVSFELFLDQNSVYQKSILDNSALKIGIEAASGFGWQMFINDIDNFFGMKSFGKSAPAKELFKYFGIEVNNIVERILKNLHQ